MSRLLYDLSSENKKLAIEHYVFDKNLPTIVFLHDSLGCIQLWREFPKIIAEATKCNYLIYDRLGYGESSREINLPQRGKNYHEVEAKVLLELIGYFNIKKPILFGHSDGGTIALIAAALQPQLFLGIITEGAHIFVEDITLKGIKEAKESYLNTNLGEKLTKYHSNKVEDIFFAWTETWLHTSFGDWNIESLLPNIICPSLIIQGVNDEFGSLQQVESIINGISGKAEQLIIENAAHTPHKENAEVTIKAVVNFINKLG